MWRRQEMNGGRAIDPRLGFLVLDMMRDVVNRGTGWRVGRTLSIPAAGKTGTTNDSKDLWFVGMTPRLAAGVWIGFDTPKTVVPGSGGGDLASPVWAEFVAAASQGAGSMEPWTPPPGVTRVQVDSETGRRWNEFCRGTARNEYFLSGTEPMADCRPDDPYWYRSAGGEWSYDSAAAGIRWPDGPDSASIYARNPDRYRTRFYDDSSAGSPEEGDRRERGDWEERLREDEDDREDRLREEREDREERLREARERRLDSLDAARDSARRRDLEAIRRNRGRIRPADTTRVRTDSVRPPPRRPGGSPPDTLSGGGGAPDTVPGGGSAPGTDLPPDTVGGGAPSP